MEYALGVDDFKITKTESVYVDKTMILEKITKSISGTSFLFTRPRRFGKSLALSMIDYFFDINKKEYSYLFNDLYVSKNNDLIEKYQNKFYVIHLNFKDVQSDNYEQQIKGVLSIISDFVYSFHYDMDNLGERDKIIFNRIKNLTASEQDIIDIIPIIMNLIKNNLNLDVIVLIDEYDSPIIYSRENGFYNKTISFFRSFYGKIFKSNINLKYGILTGVTQIAKESIFSGLNNLINNNILSNENEYFGFVDEEVQNLLKNSKLKIELDDLKSHYGNYKFGNNIVMNPWSVLSCLQNEGILDDYWVNTSSNSLLKEIINELKDNDELSNVFYNLIVNKDYYSSINPNIIFSDLLININNVISILVSSGYLTYGDANNNYSYPIFIPNIEIKNIFTREIIERFLIKKDLLFYSNLSNMIINDEVNNLEKFINEYLLSSFSYYELNNEKSYQIIVLTLCSIAFNNHLVKSEQNVGKGRCDIIVYPNKEENFGIIIETKYSKTKLSSSRLEALAKKAIIQIEENEYINDLKKMSSKSIYIFGFAFSNGKTKIISKKIN